ncbi:MAG TPA: tannase/feruloyl esterase family alpha/beta hydrolase [Gammaproteobacteria bacterium]|nr:tannase/feruloyl esterase family alpha/beta hydrolase [Gammaproteobacteria bacterium]HAJ76908.1 tannase/feruloyl esterase family alpha/beta hydrolase [Gammaproteobacteria bacterium]
MNLPDRTIVKLTSLFGMLMISSFSLAQSQSDWATACNQLSNLELAETTISSTEVVAANSFTPPNSNSTMALPAFCRVVGVTSPAVNFEVWMPLQNWNRKYNGVGNGGMAGTISYGAMAGALRRGYATASTDTGHTVSPVPFDASWASGRPDLIEDFGHRALHVTTVNGKAITEAFYSDAPAYSYYTGCSKGGQMGLMEAQRYPYDFDGIVAGDPANDWTRFYAGSHLWYSLAMLEDESAWIPRSKLPALGNAVNAACDALDGIEDGILQNPLACNFQPAALTCPEGVDNDSCLTPKQVTSVEKIWSGVTNSSGELIYPGLVPGGEAAPGGWGTWVTGAEPYSSLHWRGGEGFFRWFVFDDEDWDFRTFDFDRDLEYALEKVGPAVDSDDPDIRALRDNGSKLIVYHGWSDPDISPVASINYFESVVDVIADDMRAANYETALSSTQNFFRLFMVPGMGHCSGGPGPDRFDALSALENWVEHGIAPESITASKIVDGEVTRTRPLCVFPEVATYSGRGSTDEADSFYCAAPAVN